MAVLVTGATGFIGRRLVARLCADGEQVHAMVMPGEEPGDLGGARIVVADITDADAVERAVANMRRVYHLAAVVGDWGPDELFERVNVGGTRNVLDAAAAAGCERVLMVSSIVVYGWQLHTTRCDEDVPRELGVGPYGRTKRASEELALDYHDFGRVPVTIVRPGNVYGPGSGLWVDEMLAVIRRGAGVVVDGGKGDAVLAYVDNVVDVIVRAAVAEVAIGRIYNANDGSGVTWSRYLDDLARIGGCPPVRRSIPHVVAVGTGAAMERAWSLLGRAARPLLTREAATLLSSRYPAPVERAITELGYEPIGYATAMKAVAAHVRSPQIPGGAS